MVFDGGLGVKAAAAFRVGGTVDAKHQQWIRLRVVDLSSVSSVCYSCSYCI